MRNAASPASSALSARLSDSTTFRACAGESESCDAGCVRCDGDCETTELVADRLERMAEGYFG